MLLNDEGEDIEPVIRELVESIKGLSLVQTEVFAVVKESNAVLALPAVAQMFAAFLYILERRGQLEAEDVPRMRKTLAEAAQKMEPEGAGHCMETLTKHFGDIWDQMHEPKAAPPNTPSRPILTIVPTDEQ